MSDTKATPNRPLGPIVSASHLATGGSPALSEFEFGLMMMMNAFQRWMVRAMIAAGVQDVSPLDVMVLNAVQHRARPKRLADICLVLNVEDTHTVSYAIKKLERAKLVKSGKAGKEKVVTITPAGEAACARYRDIRETLLVKAVKSLGVPEERLSEIASTMRVLSGHYDQAARSAASL